MEDYIVALALAGTWPIYFLGGLYVLGPVLGVMLTAIVLVRKYVRAPTTARPEPPAIPIGVWFWIAGMGVMQIALLGGHWSYELSTGQTLKSTIGWAKGWALFAMFTLAGACLDIRFETIIRATGLTALISLLLTPLLYLAPMVGLPEVLFVSPLRVVGGPGPEFFAVQLYSMDPADGLPRWRYFTPWSPAAALIGNLYLILAIEDRRMPWRVIGIISALAIIILSKSRLGLVTAVLVWPAAFGVSQLRRSILWLAAAVPVFLAGLFSPILLAQLGAAYEGFRGMRANSTRVREALGRIAIDRWWNEAPIWGHGVVERGPHYVEYMPIGSHHTWFGLLFVKGVVGVGALVIPLMWSLLEFALLALSSPIGRAAFAITILLVLFTVGENLEILTYLFWPGLLIMGIAMREAAEKRSAILAEARAS
ncbi:O-antigen ligase domain-containing protein [Maricaulis maris]|uniref:O-antigen ligase domain-containing protein n=1 Tax=Maricaulis maris TaxID=74318 RepID=UPI003B8BAB7C